MWLLRELAIIATPFTFAGVTGALAHHIARKEESR